MSTQTSPSVLPEAIYAELRARIIDQAFPPGATLTETSVATLFTVARPTAKSALERLVADGVLRREAHRAARVPLLTADEIADLFDNRALLEVAAVERLAADGILPARAIAANRALLEAASARTPFAAHDIDFHRALVAGQPSPRLQRMHDLLMGEVELCIGQVQAAHLISAAEVGAQHQGILDAILAGDTALAARLTDEHIGGSRDRLVASASASASASRTEGP